MERYAEAEAEFLEELKSFPQNTRARAGLAMIYQATEQPEAAARVLEEMTRVTPTPDSFALAARLYTMFGNLKEAEAVRAESRRTFPAAKTPPRDARD
jgi:Tfp pilus assembly protein PilF